MNNERTKKYGKLDTVMYRFCLIKSFDGKKLGPDALSIERKTVSYLDTSLLKKHFSAFKSV